MRLFFALDLPTEHQEAMGRWQRTQDVPLRWTPPANLHVTLAFLGGVDEARLSLAQVIGARVARRAPIDIRTTELGGFPSLRHTRVLWLGLAPSKALWDLAAELRGALQAEQVAFDAKPFVPHLTLARAHRSLNAEPLVSPDPLSWRAEMLRLMESRGGAYEVRGQWQFA